MRYQQFIRYSVYIRYGVFFLTLFFAIIGIQAYMNNKNLQASIEQVRDNIVSMQHNNAYHQVFYLRYLNSEYAPYFYGHENGLLYENERAIRFTHRIHEPPAQIITTPVPDTPIYLSTPQASREHFFYTNIVRYF